MKQTTNRSKLINENTGTDILAKMLSDVGITVVYKKVRTAYCDLENKVVIIPFWDVSKLTSIALRAHEVGHMLYSPLSDFHAVTTLEHHLVKQAGIKHQKMIKKYVNVLEDVRIERLISMKYRGLSRILAAAHTEMFHSGFYKGHEEKEELINVEGVKTIIDKILILSRLGTQQTGVQFTPEDMEWYELARTTETFTDVVALAIRIYMLEEHSQQNSDFDGLLEMIGKVSKELLKQIKEDVARQMKKEKKERAEKEKNMTQAEKEEAEPFEDDEIVKIDGESEEGEESGESDNESDSESNESENRSEEASSGKSKSMEHGSNLEELYDAAKENHAVQDGKSGSITVQSVARAHEYFSTISKKLNEKIFF